jgi:hypothetical protein
MPETKGGDAKKKGAARLAGRSKGTTSKSKKASPSKTGSSRPKASTSKVPAKGRARSTPGAAGKTQPAATRGQDSTKKRAKSGSPKPETAATALTPLTDEEQIESSKYLPRQGARRVFEEERFVFPQSYGRDRIRLLVKDPEWLFAHWDLDRASVGDLRREMGERTVALSKLTLRISDPDNGGMSVVLLPPGVRSWYVRADSTQRAYKAELGLTLPSGEFRSLAESNTVVTPRVGPSSERASRVLGYRRGRQVTPEPGLAVGLEEPRASRSEAGPWNPVPAQWAVDNEIQPPVEGETPAERGGSSELLQSSRRSDRGGASESFGPGASGRPQDPGASDGRRR